MSDHDHSDHHGPTNDSDYDSRQLTDLADDRRVAELRSAASEISDQLEGDHTVHVASLDRTTGNAAVVVSRANDDTGEDFVRRALHHLQAIGPVLGLAPEQPPEFTADPHVQRTSSGAAAVHAQQLYKGITIYEAAETVRFDPSGRLTEVAGRTHTVREPVVSRPTSTAVVRPSPMSSMRARPGLSSPRP